MVRKYEGENTKANGVNPPYHPPSDVTNVRYGATELKEGELRETDDMQNPRARKQASRGSSVSKTSATRQESGTEGCAYMKNDHLGGRQRREEHKKKNTKPNHQPARIKKKKLASLKYYLLRSPRRIGFEEDEIRNVGSQKSRDRNSQPALRRQRSSPKRLLSFNGKCEQNGTRSEAEGTVFSTKRPEKTKKKQPRVR